MVSPNGHSDRWGMPQPHTLPRYEALEPAAETSQPLLGKGWAFSSHWSWCLMQEIRARPGLKANLFFAKLRPQPLPCAVIQILLPTFALRDAKTG